MSTFEKIAGVLIGVVIIVMTGLFLYNELRERSSPGEGEHPMSDFDNSLGDKLVMGSFDTTVGTSTSDLVEADCIPLQPVIIGALHDIKEHLEHWGNPLMSLFNDSDAFEVDQVSLDTLCHQNATITMKDANGDTLLLQKIPFTRAIPEHGTSDDIGTRVHIDATATARGAATSTQPTTYGEVLIPDRYLDTPASGSR